LVPVFDIVTVWLPLGARVPVQSAVPEAVQLVAATVVHVSVVVPLSATAVAARVMVGTMSAVSACMNPYPDSKLGDGVSMATALLRKAW
jgi:hypothetical protein